MSNYFGALDSDDEGGPPAPAPVKKKPAAPRIVEPSKLDKRPIKNDRNTRGGRSDRPPVRDGKRTYERRSGTGRGREIKKDGGGGHNWGSDQNDAKRAEGPVTEGKEDINTPEATDKVEGEEAAAVEEKEPEPEPEPEPVTISYDEYMASKSRPDSVAFQPLAARNVTNEFAGKSASKKKGEGEFLVMKGGKQLKKKGSSGKKEKDTLVLDFKVKGSIGDERRDGRRDSGGRREFGRRDSGGGRGRGGGDRDYRNRNSFGEGGGRGGGRGGGGGGRGEGGGGHGEDGGGHKEDVGGGTKKLDVLDTSAFPSL